MNTCKECNGGLEILGTGDYNTNIRVYCKDCRIEYFVEPDGLGMAGFGWVEARQKEIE